MPSRGYDQTPTMYSPDGRIYQVEYALETVKRGTLAVGIKGKDCVILAVEEKPRKLQIAKITQKIFRIDDHIGVAAAGYIPDARNQVDEVRFFSQSNRMVYDEPIEVETVAKHIADQCLTFTQYAGVRPYGVALIIAGADLDGPSLYLTDPSGAYLSYDAVAIGAGTEQVTEFLEKHYKKDMPLDDTAALAVAAIYLASDTKDGIKHIKMSQVKTATRLFEQVSEQDLEKHAANAKTKFP